MGNRQPQPFGVIGEAVRRLSGGRSGGGGDTGARELGRRTVVMASGTVLSRLTGFGRVLALGIAIGFNNVTDTYALANTTPNIVYELVLGGILSATLVPVIVGALSSGSHAADAAAAAGAAGAEAEGEAEAEAERGISALVSVTAAVLVAVSVALAVAAPLVIRLYTAGDTSPSVVAQRVVAARMLVLFAPQVALYGTITLATALLQARRRFAAPMFTPVLNNLVVIGVLVAFPFVARSTSDLGVLRDDGTGIALLGLGTTTGVLIQALALGVSARRAGVALRWVWQPGHPLVRRIVRLSGWTLGFVAANQVAAFVVILLANRGAAGDLAAYQAGMIFFLLPHAVLSVSLMTALLPELSERWAVGDVAGFRSRLRFGLRLCLVVLVPAGAVYAVIARPLVALVLQHGALTGASAQLTADVLALLALGLPGFSCFLLLSRAYNAMQDTRSLFFLYLLENGVNIGLAILLYPALGVRGLAVSYSVAYTVAAIVALAHLRRRTRSGPGQWAG
ncbi:MAG: murein biosynthesis integral membrane protein MurJ, partial [Acidimicrobiales bacterium]